MKYFFLILIFLTLAGPLWLIFSGKVSFTADYRTANRSSMRLAPDPATIHEAVIQVYAARAFNWRGIISLHTWIAVKPENAQQYTVFQVVGWRLYRQLSPVVAIEDVPDRNWFDQKPEVILDIRGVKAEKLIPEIARAVQEYPYQNEYHIWPGPNSNTFTAYVARQVPDMQLALPGNALGKDYLTGSRFFSNAESGTGYQISFYGIFGITLARREGLEINILGLVYGFSPALMTIKLPGFGDIRI
jgi:hypothetical protein